MYIEEEMKRRGQEDERGMVKRPPCHMPSHPGLEEKQ